MTNKQAERYARAAAEQWNYADLTKGVRLSIKSVVEHFSSTEAQALTKADIKRVRDLAKGMMSMEAL